MNDITKLPKWAQEYIYTLKKEVAFWNDEQKRSQYAIDRITIPIAPEDIRSGMIVMTPTWNGQRVMPQTSNVRFHFHKPFRHSFIEICWGSVSPENEHLRLYGDTGLVVMPESSNVISVRLKK